MYALQIGWTSKYLSQEGFPSWARWEGNEYKIVEVPYKNIS